MRRWLGERHRRAAGDAPTTRTVQISILSGLGGCTHGMYTKYTSLVVAAARRHARNL